MNINEQYQEVIDEAMRGINDLPTTTGLFISEFHGGVVLSLYDTKTNTIYGMMNAIKDEFAYHVSAVAAEKGFGPLIYELALMYFKSNGTSLHPDISGGVKDAAMDIWLQFYNRSDVHKETIEPSDFDFSYTILGELHPSDPHYKEMSYEEKMSNWKNLEKMFNVEQKKGEAILLAFNSFYWMDVNPMFTNLIQRGKEQINNGFNVDVALDAATEYWDKRY